MFILNEEIKEQERQAIRELYPKFPDTQVIVTKVPLKPFYKAHRIQFVAMAHVTKILAKYGYLSNRNRVNEIFQTIIYKYYNHERTINTYHIY